MNTKQLYAALEQAGWAMAPQADTSTGVTWYAWRRLKGAKNCLCNDKPPSLCIVPYSLTFGEIVCESVQFEIRGQIEDGHWIGFKVYSVPFEDVIPQADMHADTLRKAWNAVAD
jgi:hypothetical protein